MEVASPLSFVPSNTGAKRQFPCTQSFVDARNPFDSPDEFLQQRSFKRRRFAVDVSMDGDSENNVNVFTLPMHQAQQKGMFASDNGMWKRHRTDASSPQHDLQKVAEVQAAEIQSLKHEKANLESNFNALKSEHDRVVNENKILKRAVTIQQERQSHASSEIEGARRFKVDAEDRIKKLEHIVLSLRYHLQTQQSNHSYDIMGFPPRPPDVY